MMFPDFDRMPPLFALFFLLILGIFAFTVGRALVTAINNLSQPLIAREARIVGKRQHTSVHAGHGHMAGSTSTSYFITFEFQGGSRDEFHIPTRSYALLAEGDEGTLRTQGTWFKGFNRSSARPFQ